LKRTHTHTHTNPYTYTSDGLCSRIPSWPFHLHIHFGIGIFSLPCGATSDIERWITFTFVLPLCTSPQVTGVTQRAIEAIYWCHMTGKHLPPLWWQSFGPRFCQSVSFCFWRVIKSSSIKKLCQRFLQQVSSVVATTLAAFGASTSAIHALCANQTNKQTDRQTDRQSVGHV